MLSRILRLYRLSIRPCLLTNIIYIPSSLVFHQKKILHLFTTSFLILAKGMEYQSYLLNGIVANQNTFYIFSQTLYIHPKLSMSKIEHHILISCSIQLSLSCVFFSFLFLMNIYFGSAFYRAQSWTVGLFLWGPWYKSISWQE